MNQVTQPDLQKLSAAAYGVPDQSAETQPASTRSSVVQLLNLSDLDTAHKNHAAAISKPAGGSTNPLHNIKTRLTICIGTAEISVGELLGAREQQVLRLDQTIDQAVDILLEGQVVARGVLVAVDEYFGVRITELPVTLTA